MGSNGKRDVLRSIDYLLYCHIAYTYFLDTSLLMLFLKILLQLVHTTHMFIYPCPNEPFLVAITIPKSINPVIKDSISYCNSRMANMFTITFDDRPRPAWHHC